MATDWDLEDWLLDAGEAVETKRIAHGEAALSPLERLIREVWLLDMEIRNGGLSQYFGNRGAHSGRRCAPRRRHAMPRICGPSSTRSIG